MSGIFNAAIFNNTIFNTGASGAIVTPDVVKTGTGGVDGVGGDKRRSIVKPLGTLGLPKKAKRAIEDRIEDTRSDRAEIASRLAREFSEENIALGVKPITQMTMAEVEFEIGVLLHKQLRTQDDEALLLLLMIAAAV